MEPQIIQYYNELPYYAIVIDDLNKCFEKKKEIVKSLDTIFSDIKKFLVQKNMKEM